MPGPHGPAVNPPVETARADEAAPACAQALPTAFAPRAAMPGVQALWDHAPRGAALQIVAVIVGGLALEAVLGRPGQHAATLWAWLLWAWLYRSGGSAERRSLVLCTLIAGSGEAVLALVWGLYDYRYGNLPLYVPPGHALLMTLGLLALRAPAARATAPWVCVLGAAWAVICFARGADGLGVALFGLFALCMAFGRDRPLYAVMFALALAMEIYGTAVGAWTWRPEVPGLGVSAANPPFAAGAFYAVLDLLVLAAVAAIGGRRSACAGATAGAGPGCPLPDDKGPARPDSAAG
ncbi:MAG: hypothetical protein ACK5TE_10030 [Pseudomonadota bacterium]